MYDLRQRICGQIDAGETLLEDGMREFEQQRVIYIQRLRDRLRREYEAQKVEIG